MKLKYNDKTGSLQYLVTDEESPKRKWVLWKPLSCIRDTCSRLTTDRIILLSALIMSAAALTLSFFTTIRLHEIQTKKINAESAASATMMQIPTELIAMNTSLMPPVKGYHASTFSVFEEIVSTTDSVNHTEFQATSSGNYQLSGDASSPTPKPAGLNEVNSLDEVFARLDILNTSYSRVQEAQDQRWQDLNQDLRNFINNEAITVRYEVEDFMNSHREYTRNINQSLSELQEKYSRQDNSSQHLTEYLKLHLNETVTINELWEQIERLSNKADDEKHRVNSISEDLTKLSDMENVINETISGLQNMMERAVSLTADMTRNLSRDSTIKSLSTQSKIRQFQIKFGNTDRQLRSLKMTLQLLKSNHTKSTLTPKDERDLVLQVKNTANTLKATQRTVESLGQKVALHDSALTRDDARIQSCEIRSKMLSISLEENEKKLRRKVDAGWIQAVNGYSYHISQTLFKSWFSARRYCERINSTLAYRGPKNSAMKNFLFTSLIEPRGKGAWIGLSDSRDEGIWKWIDGDTLNTPTYSNWAPGQPNSFKGDQDCAEISTKEGKWNDLWCTMNDQSHSDNAALCEKMQL